MEKDGKKKSRRRILAGMGLAVTLAAGGIFFMGHSGRTEGIKRDSQAQAISVNAGRATLSATIVGSGHLQNAGAQEVQVPAGLYIESVSVEAGDTVSAGEILASIDQAALTASIAKIQNVIVELDVQISETAGETDAQSVTSRVGGRVKKICAAAGDAVTDVMISDGALLVLSLDGKMAVQTAVPGETETVVGDSVSVTLSDGTAVSGTVEGCTGGKITVTLTDDGTALGDTVTISDSSGQTLGTGTLCVHQPLEITGTAGQVTAVHVSEDQWVEAEEELLTLSGVDVSAEYQQLLSVRTVYKEKLKELMALAEDCAVTAPADGVIESVALTAGTTTAASSAGNESTENASAVPATGMSYSNGRQAQSGLLRMSTAGSGAGGASQPEGLALYEDPGDAQETGTRSKEAVSENSSSAGEDTEAETVNGQYEIKEDSQQEAHRGSSQQQDPQEQISQEQISQEQVTQAQVSQTQISQEQISQEQVSQAVSEDAFEMPDTQGLQEQVTGFTLAVQDHMILSVDIDELDILSVEEGQEAEITMDAAEGETFTGKVTQVADSTSGSDGSAKYTVQIQVAKDERMRVGMSASATIVTEKRENVIVIQAEAVQERGREVFVYTQYDQESGRLSGEKEIRTGMSDGEKVEVTDGLEEGVTVYYEKTTLSETGEATQEDRPSDLQPGKDPGGGMPGGSLPEGMQGRPMGQQGGR